MIKIGYLFDQWIKSVAIARRSKGTQEDHMTGLTFEACWVLNSSVLLNIDGVLQYNVPCITGLATLLVFYLHRKKLHWILILAFWILDFGKTTRFVGGGIQKIRFLHSSTWKINLVAVNNLLICWVRLRWMIYSFAKIIEMLAWKISNFEETKRLYIYIYIPNYQKIFTLYYIIKLSII